MIIPGPFSLISTQLKIFYERNFVGKVDFSKSKHFFKRISIFNKVYFHIYLNIDHFISFYQFSVDFIFVSFPFTSLFFVILVQMVEFFTDGVFFVDQNWMSITETITVCGMINFLTSPQVMNNLIQD